MTSQARGSMKSPDKANILIAEDDADDRLLLEVVFKEFLEFCEIHFVEDGDSLMEYLLHEGIYGGIRPRRPALILLDLHMPKKGGWQALVEIKGRADLKDIPVVIWTTSREEEDKLFCVEAGAADYVTKPSNFRELDAAVREILKKWLRITPPPQKETRRKAEVGRRNKD